MTITNLETSANMFKFAHTHVGPVKPGEKTTIVFPYEGIHVTSMTASCGCTDPVNDPTKGQITVDFNPPALPIHLKQQGKKEFTTSKTIKIEYVPVDKTLTDEGKQNTHHQILVFTALIVEP